ncbi:hypothetical protein [Frigoriglobus tundricola]|uniref:Uncharacterized protein n=1 Tax=Frigoriglobus tundricola TaxID=2774151 RepID=A0A6M5YQK4_9BACT|nr:hypothetical protein [Frigoriglobus tundricola]QJW95583.1 hypothetical protein FTUN_3133 [Frigoriglobus tundricola]
MVGLLADIAVTGPLGTSRAADEAIASVLLLAGAVLLGLFGSRLAHDRSEE